MKYYCRMIKVKEGCREEYLRLHQEPREELQRVMKDNGMKRHAIFIRGDLLVSCFEYDGKDFERDMKRIGDHPVTKAWWERTSPLQEPMEDIEEGEWWSFLEPVTFFD